LAAAQEDVVEQAVESSHSDLILTGLPEVYYVPIEHFSVVVGIYAKELANCGDVAKPVS
jgi:hypothetical protein